MLPDSIRVRALEQQQRPDKHEQCDAKASPTSTCEPLQDALLFTPARKAAFLKPVVRATQGKRLRAGPALPFLDDFTKEDARRSLAQHDAEWTSNVKKPKRKQSASF